MVSNAKLIGEMLLKARIPSFGVIASYAENGAVMGISADYLKLGEAAGNMVDGHLNGQSLQNTPVFSANEPRVLINTTTADALGLKIPKDLKGKVEILTAVP